jgi:hypothetical protein
MNVRNRNDGFGPAFEDAHKSRTVDEEQMDGSARPLHDKNM